MSSTLATSDRPAVPPAPVSFEEFLAWSHAEDTRAEWVDGKVVLMSPNGLEHQDAGIAREHRVLRRLEPRGHRRGG